MSWPYWDFNANEFADPDVSDLLQLFWVRTIDRLSRLSFSNAVMTAVPAVFHACVPNREGRSASFKFIPSGADIVDVNEGIIRVTKELCSKMTQRIESAEVEDWLYSEHDGIDEEKEVCNLMMVIIMTMISLLLYRAIDGAAGHWLRAFCTPVE